jgi:peptide/nickel transport system permease protein
MRAVLLRRLAALIPTVLLSSVLIFGLVQIIPGGAAEAVAGPDASPEMILTIQHQMGLDRPLPVQYGDWLWNMVHGDFGHSLLDDRLIGEDIAGRLPLTLELTAAALVIALLVGMPLGILSAIKRRTAIDSAVTGLSGLGLALPEFWLAMLAVDLFALQFAWVPAIGVVPLSDDVWGHINSMILPALTLASGAAAVVTRFTRGGMIEALSSPYIRTARALGLPHRQIICRFALKNALVPVLTVVGIVAGGLFGGAVLVEQVFVIPGLGALLITGVLQKDYPTVQGVALVLTVAVVTINLSVDLLCTALDPRTRR